MKQRKLLSALLAGIMLLTSVTAVGAEEAADATEQIAETVISDENAADEKVETISEEKDTENQETSKENTPKEENSEIVGETLNEENEENGENDLSELQQDEVKEKAEVSFAAAASNEASSPLGTDEYELLYYNSFDTDDEQDKNPIKLVKFADNSQIDTTINNGRILQWLTPKTNAYFINMEKEFDLTPGYVYEVSFSAAQGHWNGFKLYMGTTDALTWAKASNPNGMELGNTSTIKETQNNQSGTKVIMTGKFVYNPSRNYLTIANASTNANGTNVYIDDFTLRKVCEELNENEISRLYPDSKLNKKLTSDGELTMTNIALIDLSSTKKLLSKGEITDLKAYSQSMPENAKMSDIIGTRALIDNSQLTVKSSNEDVVVYKDGQLCAVGIGSAVLEVSDGTNTSKMVIAVHEPYAEKVDIVNGKGTPWVRIKNPQDNSETVSASAYIASTATGISTADPTVIHYRKYFNGTSESTENAVLPFYMMYGSRNMTTDSQFVKVYNAFKEKLCIGWNDVHCIASKPDGNGSTSIKVYVNGEVIGTLWYDQSRPGQGKGDISITPSMASNKTIELFDIYRTLEVVSLKEILKPESVKITKDSGNVLNIDDVDKIFSDSPEIPMPAAGGFEITFNNGIDETTLNGNVVLTDDGGNEVEIKTSVEKRVLTITPVSQLDFDSKYVLKLKEGLKAVGKDVYAADKGKTAEYSFVTEKKPLTYSKLVVDGKILKVYGLSNNRDYEQKASLVLAAYSGDKCTETAVVNLSLKEYEKLADVVEITVTDNIAEYEFFAWNTVIGNDLRSLNMDTVILDTARSAVDIELLNGAKAIYNVNYNAQTGKAAVSGQSGQKMENVPVAVRIVPNGEVPSESNILRIEEVKTGKDGMVGYTFGFDGESGKAYDVYINVNGEEPVICTFGFSNSDDAAEALKKINSCTSVSQVSGMIDGVRKTLGLINDGFETVGAKNMICGSLLKNVPYDTTTGGVELFDKTYNKALTLAKLLDDADENTYNTIVENSEYWGIEKTSAHEKFQTLTGAERNAVYSTMKKAESVSELNGSFATGVIVRAILAQASYSSVYAAMLEFDDIMTLDKKAYSNLKAAQQMNVCSKIVAEAESFIGIKAIEKRFAELCANEKKSGTESDEPKKSSGNSSYSSGGKTSAGDSYNGVNILPGTVQTTNPKPDWYVDETAAESFSVFTDLQNFDWAVSSIKKLYESGAINGKAEGIFAPNDMITREELCKIITIAMGITKKDGADVLSFNDVDSNAWYAQYIDICSSRGIINGIGNNSFGVGRYVTREEAATILVRAAEAAGKSLDYYVTIFPFDDDDEISDWARSSIETLRECQVINGVSETEAIFAPKNNVTRAAASKMIVGVINFSY